MVCNFVKNTPWRIREEKVTIQAFHKLVWPWSVLVLKYLSFIGSSKL
jgi:hypothetical protein